MFSFSHIRDRWQSGSMLKVMWAATWQNQQSDCAPSEDSDQPGHPASLIRLFAVRMKKAWTLSYPLSAQRRLWSDWADAQADLGLRWAHSHIVGFVTRRFIFHLKTGHSTCLVSHISEIDGNLVVCWRLCEPRHDKANKVTVRPAKTKISLGIRPVWSEPSLCAQLVAKDPRFLHADSEDSDQTGRMPWLIWVFAGRTVILLVLSCRGSYVSNLYLQIHSNLGQRRRKTSEHSF